MQTVKLKRIGSTLLEEINPLKFYEALRKINSVDDILRIGNTPYVFSSLTLEFPSSGAGGDTTVIIPVTNTEALQLFSVPKLMIPSPGVGKFIQVKDVYGKNNFGTTPFAGFSPRLRYVGVTANDICQFDTPFLTSTQTVVKNGNINITNAKTFIENAGVELYTSGLNPSGGDGSFIIVITYSIKDY